MKVHWKDIDSRRSENTRQAWACTRVMQVVRGTRLAVSFGYCELARLHCCRMLSFLVRSAQIHACHLREKAMSVFFSSIAAKGLNREETLELVPLACFIGLSGEGLASGGRGLKLLGTVSYGKEPRWLA